MRDYQADLNESVGSDPLFGRLADALDHYGPGRFHACGAYVLESLTHAETGGLLVACEPSVSEVAREVAAATGLAARPGGGSAAVELCGDGSRGVMLVPRLGGIESHLADSGFTVLALAVDLIGRAPRGIIDPLGGLADLERGALRLAAPTSIIDDPSRELLAADLRRRFGLEPDEETMLGLRSGAAGLAGVPARRAWHGISRLMMASGLSDSAAFLNDTGALEALLPEVAAICGVPQNYYHHLGVWEHTLETLDRLEEMLADPRVRFKAHGARIASYLTRPVEGGVRRRALLAFAGLIHDVGKAATMSVEPTGRIRFQGHQVEGGRLADGIAIRLGLGRKAREQLVAVVRDHMRLGFLLKEGESTASRLRAALELSDHCVEVVMLSLADRLATRGEAATDEGLERFKRVSTRVMADWFWLKDFPPLVDGRDIMVHTSIEAGPDVGRALFAARVAQRESTIADRRQALEFLAPDFKGKMDVRGEGPTAS